MTEDKPKPDKNKLTESDLRNELHDSLGDYSFEISIEETESYWDERKAWAAVIKPRFHDELFKIHIEEMDGCFMFELAEDAWEHPDQDNFFKYFTFELLNRLRRIKNDT